MIAHGDVLEVVTLVGGGRAAIDMKPLSIGTHVVRSRLLVGTGKYANLELMRDCLEASGPRSLPSPCGGAVVRPGRDEISWIISILASIPSCPTRRAASRLKMPCGPRGSAANCSGPGESRADWVNLEVLADTRTLLPDPVATLEATRVLVNEGFQVLCYTSDDPVMARRLKEAGGDERHACWQPDRQRARSAQPQQYPDHPRGPQEGDPDYPVIVDAGVGTASDVTIAMELGCDGVLLNMGIAGASDPLRMAHAMRLAVEAAGWPPVRGAYRESSMRPHRAPHRD